MGFNEAFEYSEFMIFYVRKLRYLFIKDILISFKLVQDHRLWFDIKLTIFTLSLL